MDTPPKSDLPGAAVARAAPPTRWSIVPAQTTAVLATACCVGIDWRNCNKRKVLRDMFAAEEELVPELRGGTRDSERFERAMNRMAEHLEAQRRATHKLLRRLRRKEPDPKVWMLRMLRDVRI